MNIRPEILLHPNIPKPLHGLAPRVILGWQWWEKERSKAYRKEGYCCHACGIPAYKAKYKQFLEAHECYRIDYKAGTMTYLETVALCHSCHSYIHSGRLEMLLAAWKITLDKYNDIMSHGTTIISEIPNLEQAYIDNPYVVNFTGNAPWEVWRLVLYKKEYKGKFKDLQEWANCYKEVKE